LEFHHHVERHPILVPAPGVEFRMVGGAQVQVPVLPHELQQEPDLLLALVVATRVAADVPVRHLIAQPVTGTGDDAHMLGLQPHFFVQFPEHRLFGCLAPIDAALRKLPAVCAYALAPEHLVFLVEQDDADVGPKAVPVKHNQTPIFKLSSLCTAPCAEAKGSTASAPHTDSMKATQFFISTLKEA